MSAPTYKIVQFVPDPFSGARVPLAALVTDGDSLRIVRSPHVPGPECLGGARRAAVARMVVEALCETSSFDRLPAAVGPQAVLDGARTAPVSGLDAAERWVREHVLPQRASDHRENKGARGPQRATLGTRFFETWNVRQYVRSTFQPESDFGGRLTRMSSYGAVSHWVDGRGCVLLMEPIVPRRAQFAEDLREVAKLFGSYRFALQHEPATCELAELVAYILPGGTDSEKAEAAAAIPSAHRVVDTEQAADRAWFLDHIRHLGRRGERQQHLD